MGSSKETAAQLRAENEELRRRLEEAEQTLEAIRSGEVDALIVSGAAGEQVFTLKGADYAYRSLVENMCEGAATLDAEGTILYCNKRLAEMLQLPLEKMVTSAFRPLVSPPDCRVFDALFQKAARESSKGELNLVTANGSLIPVNLSLNVLKLEGTPVTVIIATDLTQQKVLVEMVAAEQLATSITDQANEAILVCDENGQIIRASAVATDLCGVDPLFKQFEDVFRISVADSNPGALPRTGAESLLRFNDLLKGRGISQSECTLPCPQTDKKLNLLVSAGPLRDTVSRTIGCVITLTNITEFKKTVDALRESEEQIRASLENAPDGIYMNDLEGNFLYGNRRCEEIIGYKREELIGKNFLELNILSEISLTRAAELLKDNIKGKSTGPDEVELISRDGRRVPLEINTSVVQRKGQAVVLSFVRDITERRLAEEVLRKSEAQYHLLAEHTTDTVWLMDMNLKSTYTSPSSEKLLGFTQQELIEMSLEKYLTPDSLRLASEAFFRELPRVEADPNYDPIITLELEYYCKDGTTLWAENKFNLIRDENGKPVSILGETRDITERKQAREKLMRLHQQNELILGTVTEVIIELDLQGNHVYVNPAAAKMLGYEVEDLLHHPSHSTWHHTKADGSPYPQEECEVYAAYRDGLLHHIDTEVFWRKDGTSFPVEYASTPIYEQGRLAGAVVTFADITERKQAEQALQQSEARYRLLADHTNDMIWLMDMNLKTVYLSPSTEKISGFTLQERMELTMEQSLTPESLKLASDLFLKELPSVEADPNYNLTHTVELEFYCKDGTTRWTENTFNVIRDESGKPAFILGEARDITERRLSNEKLIKSYESLKKTLNDAINTMVKIVEIRDPYTAGHQQKVADLATAIAKEMKLEDIQIDQLRTAAVVHDIGKMYVPSDILSKPGRLSDIEFSLIKTHAQSGYDIVKGMDFPGVVAQAILQHHERLDGSGYPNRLKSEDTLLEAKILAVADVVEAMSSYRPYRPALGIDKALEEIVKNKCKLYDPDVVDTCVELFNSGKFGFQTV